MDVWNALLQVLDDGRLTDGQGRTVVDRLERADVRRIVDVQLARFHARLADKGLRMEVSDDAKDFLANVGYDPAYGARPLKRAIQQHLENTLAKELLAGRCVAGDIIEVDVAAGELGLGKRSGEAPEPGSPTVEA